ncbi:MAG: hypothetical protein Q7R66_21520 [Undibacterium sp.]|uniref:ComEC/Rec2 family competence protein n=1 Tax=Undibacterium sp. TaxID=1914977 RepID=UPI0027261C80|nr:hypothetical protein [Undibacterium sp.]MDO8654758.1 hypothetical protein [Undibacterium sp.]
MIDPSHKRRTFLAAMSGALAASAMSHPAMSLAAGLVKRGSGSRYAPWQPGMLDIHHITTGSGNAALFIMPDGTSMLVDAGAIYDHDRFAIAPRPSAQRRPGEWIGRYARRHLQRAGRNEIDYFVLSHLHRDHMGEYVAGLPRSKQGDYALTGVTDVAEILPIRHFIDRAYPKYDFPEPLQGSSNENYVAFIRAQQRLGADVQQFSPGSNRQLALLRQPATFPEFEIRNLYANGELWAGQGEATKNVFPVSALPAVGKPSSDLPSENECSVAFRLRYGKFSYYTGGDLSNNTNFGADPWRDVESSVALVAGHVDVAVANHHGYVDSMGPVAVRALSPSAFILMTWDSAHPSILALFNMLNKRLYPEERKVFATAVKPENEVATRDIAKLASKNGHVVVRVAPGGAEYRIEILDSFNELDTVLSEHGPFLCQGA